MTCSTGCPTKDHATYGQCLRSKRQMIGYARSAYGADMTRQKLWDKELNMYYDARKAGIEPDGTGMDKIRFALDQSEKNGMAYGRDFRVTPDGKGGYDALDHKTAAEITSMVDQATDHDTIMETARNGR